MKLKNESVFVGVLTTTGRRTGLPRSVELRMVYLDGRFYASTSNVQSKHWCRNLVKNPTVKVKAAGESFACAAKEVKDEKLKARVLSLRDSPPLSSRAVFEMSPIAANPD